MSNVRRRLARLEQLCLPPPTHLGVVCTNEQGVILDDRSEGVRPWVGRHYSELPRNVKVIIGVDPLEIFGFKKPDEEPAAGAPAPPPACPS